MTASSTAFRHVGPSLQITAQCVPWDSDAFGFPVASVQKINVGDLTRAAREFVSFEHWRNDGNIRIVSCRLPHDQLRESMFLESRGFRFVEIVLHPTAKVLQSRDFPQDEFLIAPANGSDLKTLQGIAERSFRNERYHADPRIDRGAADARYGQWVVNTRNDPRQILLKITIGKRIIGLFIVEMMEDRSVYWHLTAISPECQSQGYGQRVWIAMLRHHQLHGKEKVSTTISARNVAVLNLYAKLGFRFLAPEMTFHWIGNADEKLET